MGSWLDKPKKISFAEHEKYYGLRSIFIQPDTLNSNCSTRGSIYPSTTYALPTGIPNYGNTCYMNALFQSLLSCSHFHSYILNFTSVLTKKSAEESFFKAHDELVDEDAQFNTEMLQDFIKAYFSLLQGRKQYKDMENFYDKLCQNFTYALEQEDAHELLMVLFTMIYDYAKTQALQKPVNDFKEIVKQCVRREIDLDESEQEQKREDADVNIKESSSTLASSSVFMKRSLFLKQKDENDKKKENSIRNDDRLPFESIVNPFAGIYASHFECLSCRYSWEKNEIKYALSVSCNYPTIDQNINEEMKVEQIQDYVCLKCSIIATLSKINSRFLGSSCRMTAIETQALKLQHTFLITYLNINQNLELEDFENEFNEFSLKHRISRFCMKLIKKKSTIKRYHSIQKKPKIMCIHLNRLSNFDQWGNLTKNNNMVQYGLELGEEYKLKSVIVHYGNAFGGHYVALRKINFDLVPDSEESIPAKESLKMSNTSIDSQFNKEIDEKMSWMYASDLDTRYISLKELLSKKAYLLFYEIEE
ncbi:unnamed protein product [Moneuplotes crassus]|uniref:Ubiquitin carboxyl-terminal hydrolase n=1 Tax=Euplotes crassus TaxID=5936 RepID=A0AAD1X7Z1_EUPCR|nr:unnamed protein product [Moneuplotes crassus]